MASTQVVVVRHGETEWNLEGRLQGHLDSPLTEKGVAQARALADRLEGQAFDVLYSSDLGRAYHTAEIIGNKIGVDVTTDKRLRERHLGIFQGRTWREIEETSPDEYALYMGSGPDYVIPEGESARQRFDRTIACLEDVACSHPGATVLVVAHGGVLNGLFRHTLGIPLEASRRFKLWNAGINTFYYEDGAWTLGTWGDVGHLPLGDTLDDS
ncbi:MAG TPA: histidine phosphatase family protein [Candidatus Hydrogenedentes bacterium]|nr:histidine phosphatase family protein [Candidatus Hydrogenedentota bacterium]